MKTVSSRKALFWPSKQASHGPALKVLGEVYKAEKKPSEFIRTGQNRSGEEVPAQIPAEKFRGSQSSMSDALPRHKRLQKTKNRGL